jgi:hypothetical protein
MPTPKAILSLVVRPMVIVSCQITECVPGEGEGVVVEPVMVVGAVRLGGGAVTVICAQNALNSEVAVATAAEFDVHETEALEETIWKAEAKLLQKHFQSPWQSSKQEIQPQYGQKQLTQG